MKYSNYHLKRAVEVLNTGGIISYQSDTVAGLGVLPIFENCLIKIIHFKRRDPNKGMILLGTQVNQFCDFLDATELNQFVNSVKLTNLNEPTTFLIKVNQYLPSSIASLLMGGCQKLAIRITDDDNIKAICEQVNLPIVSTSLNLANRKTLYRNYQAYKFFPNLDYYLAIDKNKIGASKIIDFETGKVIRARVQKQLSIQSSKNNKE